MKKIIEYIERWCCQYKDFRPLCDSKIISRWGSQNLYDFVQCRHCGQIHEYNSFMDCAGSRDWEYKPIKNEPKTTRKAS